jgi:hypothetical protein
LNTDEPNHVPETSFQSADLDQDTDDAEEHLLVELRNVLRNCSINLDHSGDDQAPIRKALTRVKKYHLDKNPNDLEVVCDVVKVLATSVFTSPRFEAAIERWTNPVAEALLTDAVACEQLRKLWNSLEPGADQ